MGHFTSYELPLLAIDKNLRAQEKHLQSNIIGTPKIIKGQIEMLVKIKKKLIAFLRLTIFTQIELMVGFQNPT